MTLKSNKNTAYLLMDDVHILYILPFNIGNKLSATNAKTCPNGMSAPCLKGLL